MKLHDQAMDDDYLAVEFDKAEKKLKDALKKCGKDACSPKVLGKLHIALGTVYGGGGKVDQAKGEFVLALQADPKAALIDALTTPELAKAFKDAQKDAAASAKAAEPDDGSEGTPKEKPSKSPGGDIPHTPVKEQAVNTPVPVYIEIPEEIEATKVTLRYKPFGSKKWKTLEMEAMGDGFGAEIPCEDVTTTGDIKYYIVAKDEAGDPAGTAGSLKAPYKVPIKNEIDEAPSLPGKKPPKKCAAKEDCPPGLPGCPEARKGGGEKRGDKGWGATCDATSECQGGLVCLNGTCEEGSDDKGGGDQASTGPRNLVGVWGQLDALLINGSDDVCSGKDAAYACFYPGTNDQFYGEPVAAKKNAKTNGITGGFGIAGARFLASYDRQWFSGIPLTIGLRLGLAVGGSPSPNDPPTPQAAARQTTAASFLPFHGELRGEYHFLGVYEQRKFKPFALLSAGVAQVNASVKVSVCDKYAKNGKDLATGSSASSPCPDTARTVNDLDAYQITGLNFVAVGGGVTYGITQNIGVAAELKFMFMLPTFGVVVAPSLGPVYAF